MSQQTHKRPPSPLPSQGAKRRIILRDGQNGKMNEASQESVRAILQELLVKQVELVEQVVFKDRECQRLKKRFDEIDRNCRRWHEYATGLQTRVKRLALILHRQKDSMKSLKDKGTSTAEVAVQTDFGFSASSTSFRNMIETDVNTKEPLNNTVKPKKEMFARKELGGSITNANNSSVVIDLTDEEKKKDPSQELVRQVSNGQHHDLPASTKPINAPTSRASRQENTVSSKSKSVIQKTSHPGNAQGNASPQNSGFNALSPSKGIGISASPYPPLPPNPATPSLPTNIPSPPPQPVLRIRRSDDGMELSWNHATSSSKVKMESYELFVYQLNPNNHASNRWKKIGREPIEAMALPMACTLSQFSPSSKYYFAVRGKDVYGRYSAFSTPCCSSDVYK